MLKLIVLIFGIFASTGFAYKPLGRIVGGLFAKDQEYPHQISLEYNGRLHVCGGSLIKKNWVLTAAHCVTWSDKSVIPPEDLQIRAGTNVLGIGGTIIKVTKVIVHEKYGIFHDLALLKLESPITISDSIKTIDIRPDEIPNKAEIEVYGWGKTTHGGKRSEVLKKNTLTALSTKECRLRFQFDFEQVICLESPVGQGVCQGDSGGGAVLNGQLIGVASFVKGECGTKHPDMYVRLSLYIDWINENINK